jgi:hypothetical protein
MDNDNHESTMTPEEFEAWNLRQLQLKAIEQQLKEPIYHGPFDESDSRQESIAMQTEDGKWVPARPLPAPLLIRIRNAWLVILGKREVY